MAKIKERTRARELRLHGRSIKEIAETLRVSKSTVSNWCREIQLSEKQIEKIAKRSKHHATAALLRSAEERRTKRLADVATASTHARERTLPLSRRDRYILGLGLYWGEGYKTGNQELGFTNSDPRMIGFYIRWLEEIFDISKSDLTLRISINKVHQKRIHRVTQYWSQVTGIPVRQFTKPSFIVAKLKKVYADHENHFGTLRIKVKKGTQLRREILAAIEFIAEDIK